jgi:hypothetical protein
LRLTWPHRAIVVAGPATVDSLFSALPPVWGGRTRIEILIQWTVVFESECGEFCDSVGSRRLRRHVVTTNITGTAPWRWKAMNRRRYSWKCTFITIACMKNRCVFSQLHVESRWSWWPPVSTTESIVPLSGPSSLKITWNNFGHFLQTILKTQHRMKIAVVKLLFKFSSKKFVNTTYITIYII